MHLLIHKPCSGFVPHIQEHLRAYLLSPYQDFRYNSDASALPLKSLISQVLLISGYLSSAWIVHAKFKGILRTSPGFLKLAVAHNLLMACMSLVLLLLLSDQVRGDCLARICSASSSTRLLCAYTLQFIVS
jgi:hypothetical protein